MKKFIEQIIRPRVITSIIVHSYVCWENTEEGREVKEQYERIQIGTVIYYRNFYNTNTLITKESCYSQFFDFLEELYNKHK